MSTCLVLSSYADITVNRETGEIIKIDYEACGGEDEWDDLKKFNPETLTHEEMDVLNTGFWTKDGNYNAPVQDWGDKPLDNMPPQTL